MGLRTLAPCAAAVLATAAAAQAPAPGFELVPLAASPDINLDPFGSTQDVHGVGLELSNGDLVGFDGSRITRRAADGTLAQTYAVLATPVFPSLVAVSQDETLCAVGESSTGELLLVDLVGGGVSPLVNLPFNYAAAFHEDGSLYVNHGQTVIGGGSTVTRVEVPSGTTRTVAKLPGPSGPLAFDDAGGLYCGVVEQPFQSGKSRVVRWSPRRLASGALLSEADAAPVSQGWNGIAFLAHDGERGEVLLVENDGVLGGRLWRAGPTKAESALIVAAPQGLYLGGLQLALDPGPAHFLAFQPSAGGRARIDVSDFLGGTLRSYAVVPVRPQGFAAGPGLVGPGALTVGVDGAHPGGTLVLWYAPSALAQTEAAIALPGLPPLFWTFGATDAHAIPWFLPVDAAGRASLTFFYPGFGSDAVAFQGMLLDPLFRVAGTATPTVL